MKKLSLKILSFALACTLFSLLPVNVFASDDVELIPQDNVAPCYENCGRCTTSFTVSGGTAYVGVSYDGYSDSFSYAKIKFKIEKQFLFFFWQTVDIGEPNNEWIAYCYDVDGYFNNSWYIGNNSGSYRGVFIIEIHGKDGTVDVIEDTIKST